MKIFRVNRMFSTLWGILGLWILLAASLLAFFVVDKPLIGILFMAGITIITFMLVSGRVKQKVDYYLSELMLRGIFVVAVITIPIVVAIISPATRIYLLFFDFGIFVILLLMLIEFSKAERINIDS